jgi:predicted dehydrogenase
MMTTRRAFIAQTAAAVAASAAAGGCRSLFRPAARGAGRRAASGRLNIGVIGVGGRGSANLSAALEAGETIAALCDVDETSLLAGREKVAGRCPEVRLYKDFRVLFDTERDLDAVLISTPDHGHAMQASWALDKGCHVYVETPLARTLREVRHLQEKARACGVVVQVGDHGSATEEFRRAVEVLHSGLLGKIAEAHVWTSRPVWPQGLNRPEGSDPVPASLDWDLWLGGAPVRPFKSKVYHRFNWRGWQDFGTGALGDAGTQAMGLAFRVLGLEAPVAVEATATSERLAETYPKSSTVRFDFAARGRRLPPATMQWYDGNARPAAELMPQVVAAYGQVPPSGSLLVGEKGVWVTTDDSVTRHALALSGEERVRDFEKHEACLAVPAAPPHVKSHQQEFFDAVRNGGSTYSGMAYAVPVTECVLAGCVAQRVPGRLEWNGRKGRFANSAAANLLVASAPREGWSYGK